MKRLILVAVLSGALAACGDAAEEADDTAAVEEPAAEETAAASDMPGTYEVTMADGTKFTAVLNADGTYTDTAEDGSPMEHGTWAQVDGQDCFTPAADSEGEPTCYTSSEPAEDGTFTVTPDDGEPMTVRKVA